MYPIGHVAVALMVSAPVAYVVRPRVATRFTVLIILASAVPDLDLLVPMVSHHGFTHTVGFAAAFGVVGGLFAVGASALRGSAGSREMASRRPVRAVALVGLALALGIAGHVLADSLMLLPTPQPVSPLWPFSDAVAQIETLRYGNTVRNVATFALALAMHVYAVDSSAGPFVTPSDRRAP